MRGMLAEPPPETGLKLTRPMRAVKSRYPSRGFGSYAPIGPGALRR